MLRACDIYANCSSARGKVEIPFVALPISTSTPMPTLLPTQQSLWYQTPTLVLTATATPTAQALVLPVLPSTGGDDEGGGETQGNSQPLLPLAAAALGTSVLLAAASRREEKEALAAEIRAAREQASALQQATDLAERQASVAAQTVQTVNVEAPAVAVSTLAALAGVVKESFDGLWNEAVRISPADAPITIVTHSGIDMDEYNRKLAGWIAEIEYKQTDEYKRLVAAQQSIAAAEQSSSNWNRQWLQIQAEKNPEYTATINQMANNYTLQWNQIQKENETGSLMADRASSAYEAQAALIAAEAARAAADAAAKEKATRDEEMSEGKNVVSTENNTNNSWIANTAASILNWNSSTLGKLHDSYFGLWKNAFTGFSIMTNPNATLEQKIKGGLMGGAVVAGHLIIIIAILYITPGGIPTTVKALQVVDGLETVELLIRAPIEAITGNPNSYETLAELAIELKDGGLPFNSFGYDLFKHQDDVIAIADDIIDAVDGVNPSKDIKNAEEVVEEVIDAVDGNNSSTTMKNAEDAVNNSVDADGANDILVGGENSTATILKETENYTDYLNEAGTQIRINKQTSQTINNKIADNLVNTDIGKRTEAEVADFIRNNTNAQITDVGNKVKNASGQVIGEIDCATANEIIEVKNSIASVKVKQFDKYTDTTNPQFINVENKNIILYIEEKIDLTNINNVTLINQLQENGIIVVNGLDELKGVIE